ncbi:hypothetical protein FHW36_106287 [Chitinophaga polysaccharea]|uniref:Uncharacterized protein n=1 Tax=Chitinophaga polysaccharea TaxID=1293035 RepID=A0A561PLS0_9BACT|nr:hypothetical protein [Chitinophaga polysaccharea]TWF39063.1 hypothetical protein FHW36_106287 [Chitinophaga polysaccharea]
MKYRVVVILYSFVFLFLSNSCNLICSGKRVSVGLIYANENDSLKIILNDKIVVDKVIYHGYNGRFRDRKDRLATWCISEDSTLIKIRINSRDTSFYLHPKWIKGWYVGCSMKGDIDVYYDYEVGGLGNYEPFR